MSDMAPAVPRFDSAGVLSAGEFEEIRRLALERFGLDLHSGKQQLVAARLGRPMREAGIASFREYCRYVLKDLTGAALVDMIDALTTNHTSFLREPAHFDFLVHHVLPPLMSRPLLRMWSAACATGEEPFSMALCASQVREGTTDIRILATDISMRALRTAQAATY